LYIFEYLGFVNLALQAASKIFCRYLFHCLSFPEPLLNKDISVKVNKQKYSGIFSAQANTDRDKMPFAPTYCQWLKLSRIVTIIRRTEPIGIGSGA